MRTSAWRASAARASWGPGTCHRHETPHSVAHAPTHGGACMHTKRRACMHGFGGPGQSSEATVFWGFIFGV